MNVEELKKRIHKELFGDCLSNAPPVLERKGQQKEMIMRHSVQIMQRHDQSEQDIEQMLQEKFFLTDAQAKEFMKKECSSTENHREGI